MSLHFIDLISQYPVLIHFASHLSARDLYSLASTTSAFRHLLLSSPRLLIILKRHSICSGRGLLHRQNFTGRHADPYPMIREVYSSAYRRLPTCQADEEVEVRVWAKECDAYNALPCVKCSVNVCEECRYVPRVPEPWPPLSNTRRPHWNIDRGCVNLLTYCWPCEAKIATSMPHDESKPCNCDQYTRWVCHACAAAESHLEDRLQAQSMNVFDEQDEHKGMLLPDHQQLRAMFCPDCGVPAPNDGNVRCLWCKRRHLVGKRDEPWNCKFTELRGVKTAWVVMPDEDPDSPEYNF